MINHLRRRCTGILLVMLGSLGTVVGCGSAPIDVASEAESQPGRDLQTVSVQLNWYPETEHGGLYQALADGTYRDAGLDVQIRPGGRATPIAPELDLGRCQFAVTNADDVVQFRRQGSQTVAVLAAVQNHPRCILVRADSGVTSFEDLAGMTLQRQPGRGFLQFLQQQGYLDGVNQVPYHGSVSTLVSDRSVAIQAYSFAEPLTAKQQGVETNALMVSDLGWNPYSSVLVTTETMIRDKPNLVQKMVDATKQGWINYFEDPTLGNASVLAANKHGMTPETLAFGVQQMKPLAMPENMPPERLGNMTDQRWETLVEQMNRFDPSQGGKVDPRDCYTLQFLHDDQ